MARVNPQGLKRMILLSWNRYHLPWVSLEEIDLVGWQLFSVDQLSEWSAWNVGSAVEHYSTGHIGVPSAECRLVARSRSLRQATTIPSMQRIAARLARHSELLRARGKPPSYSLSSLSPGVTTAVIGVRRLLCDQP